MELKNQNLVLKEFTDKPIEFGLNFNLYMNDFIRNSLDKWVQGFSIGLGTTNSVTVELRGLLEGLKMVSQMNITQLIIELDASAVVG